MKQINGIVIFALSMSLLTARGDFVVQQRIESPDQNGIQTLKFKGDQYRKDMPTARVGEVSIIQNIKTGTRIIMIHRQKAARIESFPDLEREFGQTNNVGNEPGPKLVYTGKSERVGDYDAGIYAWTNNQGVVGTFWVATNYPHYSEFWSVIKKINQSPVGQLTKKTEPDTSALPGMVVKSKRETPAGEATVTLISAKDEPVAASDFQIPGDYRVIGLPVTPGKGGQ